MDSTEQKPIEVNGREYPMWSQFIHRQEEWIGGTMTERDMGMEASTEITGMKLEPNGDDSAMFVIQGKDFDFCFDVRNGGVGSPINGQMTFHTRYCGTLSITDPVKKTH